MGSRSIDRIVSKRPESIEQFFSSLPVSENDIWESVCVPGGERKPVPLRTANFPLCIFLTHTHTQTQCCQRGDGHDRFTFLPVWGPADHNNNINSSSLLHLHKKKITRNCVINWEKNNILHDDTFRRQSSAAFLSRNLFKELLKFKHLIYGGFSNYVSSTIFLYIFR